MFLEEFTPLVGREMLVDCNPTTATLTLIEASAMRQQAFNGRQPFVLIFRSAPDVLLLTGNYAMRCGAFGPDVIHISQIAQLPGGQLGNYYQAVFN